jgi:Protein of unknown function (DUF3619)
MSTRLISTSHLAPFQDLFAARIVRALDEQTAALPADISERLRFARQQALEKARSAKLISNAAPAVLANGVSTAALGRGGHWGWRCASMLPLAVLVLGLISIHSWQQSSQIDAAAEVDAALLSDALPPAAYSDPGFVEFLKQRDR